jgi:solute carrier family 35 protein F5
VSSSTLIQSIFQDMCFDKPFFLTYYSTSLFTLYLLPAAWRCLRAACSGGRRRVAYTALLLSTTASSSDANATSSSSSSSSYARFYDAAGDGDDDDAAERVRLCSFDKSDKTVNTTTPTPSSSSLSSSSSTTLTEAAETRVDVAAALHDGVAIGANESSSSSPSVRAPPPLSLRETIRLAATLCPLWFGMNYAFNISLDWTSIASSTILSSTSGLFVLLISVCYLRRHFEWLNLLGEFADYIVRIPQTLHSTRHLHILTIAP